MALGAMQPLPLLAQSAEGCVPTENQPCPPEAQAAEPEAAAPAAEGVNEGDAAPAPEAVAPEPAPEPAPETPADAPPEAPADAPVEVPADTPPEAPVEAPAEAPAEAPVEVPADTPPEAPVEVPAEEPAEAPVEVPQPEAAPEAAPEPVPEAAPEVMEEPATGAVDQPALRSDEIPAPLADEAPDAPAAEPPVAEPPVAEAPLDNTTTDDAGGAEAEPSADGSATQDADKTSDNAPEQSVIPKPRAEQATDDNTAATGAQDQNAAAAPDAPAATPTEAAVDTLTNILQGETGTAAAAAAADGTAPAEAPAATVTDVTEADTRASDEDFADAPAAEAKKKGGLSDLEKFGLVALGALAVGAVLNNRDKVVSNSGDRVVVERDDGNFYVLKDDDTLLRQPGSRVETQNFDDGSTRTVVDREDGSRIITIRDASGRVLRRARVDLDGSETLLIDDLAPVQEVIVADLPPPPAQQLTISTADDGQSLRDALAQIDAREQDRAYSLRQIRDFREVRALAPTIDVDSITFDTGSAAIAVTEAEKLADLGNLIAGLIAERPNELLLIEGHTDAVGSAASNLALSDRRAESVALALTEYFAVPPENLVVQGYGESDLRIPTDAAEPANRRVAVRLITPLMQQAALD
ncbi:OmpA family protein [Fertoebacter nigrum]|uniref:OmpA family protein n=1 Tax=Fertoeibacter niger TaxID=2656921 RepID=A0A8X8GRA3_9RHOB|nr:OmpA family protein [Fertoeibacter niger]